MNRFALMLACVAGLRAAGCSGVARQQPTATTATTAALPNPALLRARREGRAKRLEEISREFDQVAQEVTALGNANADLEARRKEIAKLPAVTNQMGIQLNASEVDIAMPNRVELIEEAQEPKAR